MPPATANSTTPWVRLGHAAEDELGSVHPAQIEASLDRSVINHHDVIRNQTTGETYLIELDHDPVIDLLAINLRLLGDRD